MKRIVTFALAFVILMAFTPAATAETPKGMVRFVLTSTNPTGEEDVGNESVKGRGSVGIGLTLEYRFTDLVGLEGGFLFTRTKIESHGQGIVRTKNLPFILGLNFHVVRSEKMDFYLGPVVGYAFYDDRVLHGVKVEMDPEMVYGLNLGLDVPINEQGWFFSCSFKYLQQKVSADHKYDGVEFMAAGSDHNYEFDLNPYIFTAGLGWRF